MVSPIDDIAFLARSETRVNVMRAIDDRARDRQDLATATDTPRSTLSRTLSELEERGWIERDGRLYALTTAGVLVIEQFVPLLDTVNILQTLGEAVDLLPLDETDLTVQHLADAQFVTPTELNPTAHFDYGIERLGKADRFRCVARTAPPVYVEAIHEGVVTGRLTTESILDGMYLDDLRDEPDLKERWNEIAMESETVRRSEEPIPFVLLVLDDTVHLWLCDEKGGSQGLVESNNPDVLSWANTTVDRYLERSQPIESIVVEGGS